MISKEDEMPRYELWSERECHADKLHRTYNGSLDIAKAKFETLISRWEEELNDWEDEEVVFESRVLPGAEEGCNFVLKDEHGKRLFIYTHEWEDVR